MSDIKYLTAEKIVEINVLAVTLIKAKKADAANVLSMAKLREAVEACQAKEGDTYDKSIILLKGIVQKHPFASGNRRTALISVKNFLLINKCKFNIPDDPAQARPMQGIRENYYSDDEIKEWIKNGKIREFKR